MTEPLFEPRLQPDGTLDPECLERMGPDWLAGWIRDRLSGRDPWFLIDRRSDEDPESLIVGLLRNLGLAHPLVPLMGQAARRLLVQAGQVSPPAPSYLHPLLRLCQQVALPATGPWFLAELKSLAEQPENFAALWPEGGLADEILFAALRQAPGRPGAPARPYWQALLNRPESTTLALTALGTSLQEQVSHLAIWWSVCPREERNLELSQLIFEALIAGEEEARAILGKAASLPPDLRAAIDRELEAQGARPAFAAPKRVAKSSSKFLEDAGLRREVLLAA
jgi:hypothetical protein